MDFKLSEVGVQILIVSYRVKCRSSGIMSLQLQESTESVKHNVYDNVYEEHSLNIEGMALSTV